VPAAEPAKPASKAQRNFTDPESRIMKTKDGFIQGYNAQAAVDRARSRHGGQRHGATPATCRCH
jgi:hypothetical protein